MLGLKEKAVMERIVKNPAETVARCPAGRSMQMFYHKKKITQALKEQEQSS